jgi:excisionase family DNA binding protein
MIVSNDMQSKELLTVKEVAQYYRVTLPTVYNWINRGELEAFSVGGTVRIRPDALNNVIFRKKPTKA